MPAFTTFTFYPLGGSLDPNELPPHAMVLSDKHIKKGESYLIMQRYEESSSFELVQGGGKRGTRSPTLSTFHVIKSESGQPTVSVTRHGPHTSPGEILFTIHSPFHKTLHIGDADFQWRSVSTGVPGSITWYELQSSDGSMIAHLRVEEGVIKYNLIPEIKYHGPLCVGIVTAIVYMSLTRDSWLEGSDIDFWCGKYGPN